MIQLLSLAALVTIFIIVPSRYDKRKKAIQKYIENGDIDVSLNIDSCEECKDYIFSLDLGNGKTRLVVVNALGYLEAKALLAEKYQIRHDSILSVV